MIKKVLFISDHGDPLAKLGGEQAGGQNNYVRQLALALDKKGVKVDVVTHWSDADAPRIEKFGESCRVVRIAAGHKGFVSKNKMYELLPEFYREMKEALQLYSYDMVHTHYWLSGLIGKKLDKELNLPFIHTSHSLGIAKERATGITDTRRQEAEIEIMRAAQIVLATTKSEKLLIGEIEPDSSPVKVIPIGVDKAFHIKANRAAIRKEIGCTGPLLVYAGRLEETKGIYTLLRAYKQMVKRNGVPEGIQLIVAGGEPNAIDLKKGLPKEDKLRKIVTGIEDKVRFVGPQSQEQLSNFFNAATATIVPSYYESFGMVAAEAQGCGSPVIASNVGGLRNVVEDGVTGLLVEPKDEDDLSVAMEAIVSNDLLAQKLGKQASQKAAEEFQWPAITAKVKGLYEEVLDARRDTLVGNGSGWNASWL
ncbi:glycosyltransferase [Chungangia koreensis]|uniref:Glycosyltransferase n=1 Tax=Chungangia koreensis TaxID=752657 RepID=A0ABV8X7C9_9LACT